VLIGVVTGPFSATLLRRIDSGNFLGSGSRTGATAVGPDGRTFPTPRRRRPAHSMIATPMR